MKTKLLCERLRGPAVLSLALIAAAAIVISGCSQKQDASLANSEEAIDAEVTAEERPYFDAAKPFTEAIAARDYAKAYGYFSSHAKARMSPNQFVPPDGDAAHKKNEAAAIQNPSAEQFAQLMNTTETEYGKPVKLGELNVFSTDPVALSGKGKSAEDKLEAMFAIGMMPDSIPAGIRKASLRSKLIVELSEKDLTETAKLYDTTPQKLKADPDFQPYVTLKMVLVEEANALKVGYFEFLPPGIWD
jgi:hypothetical protein